MELFSLYTLRKMYKLYKIPTGIYLKALFFCIRFVQTVICNGYKEN